MSGSEEEREVPSRRVRLARIVAIRPFTSVYGSLLAVVAIILAIGDLLDLPPDVMVFVFAGTPLATNCLVLPLIEKLPLTVTETRKYTDSSLKLFWTYGAGMVLSVYARNLNVQAALVTPGFFISSLIAIASFGLFVDGANALIYGSQQDT